MKQLFGALCAMIVGLSALSVLPAAAAGFRDHEGWMGAPPSASMARAGRTKPAAARRWKRPAAHGWTRRPARRTSWARYYAPRPALRTYRTFKRVWFGNKMVWWPTTTVVPVARRASAYRLASWHPRRRWSKGRPVVWHGGYWATTRSGGPGTWTPEPVYRYNPNGSEPTLMKAPTASKAMRKGGSKGIAGYQYYYYGKPTTSSGVKTSSHTTRRTAAALAVPHDNIPTVCETAVTYSCRIPRPKAAAPLDRSNEKLSAIQGQQLHVRSRIANFQISVAPLRQGVAQKSVHVFRAAHHVT